MRKSAILATVAALALAGCGGGGGGGSGGSGSTTAPTLTPTVSVQLTKPKTVVGSPVTLSWSSTNATSCVGMDALSGTKATSSSEVITPSKGGQYTYTISCDGAGGTAKQSVSLIVPMPVFDTSYENKNNIDFSNTAVPTIRAMGINKLYADEQDSPDRSVTFGDFTQEGKYTAFTHTTRATNKYGIANIADVPGVPYFVQQDSTGKWIDVTSKLIPNVADRKSCITVSYAFTADLNNDGKPDVYLACTGVDADVSSVTGPGIQPGINIENSVMFLSQPDGTYKRSEVPFQLYAHKAALADLDGDGNIDVVTISTFDATPNANTGLPFVLWGNGDGTFRRDNTVFTPELWSYMPQNEGLWNVDLVPNNGKIDLVLIGGSQLMIFKDFRNAAKNGINYAAAITVRFRYDDKGNRFDFPLDTVFVNNNYYFMSTVNGPNAGDLIWNILKYDSIGEYQSSIYTFLNSPANFQAYIAQFKPQNGKFIAYGSGCPPVEITTQGMCAMSVPIQ